MAKFIEVHRDDGQQVIINAETCIFDNDICGCICTVLSHNNHAFIMQESYAQIKSLLEVATQPIA